VPQVNVMYWNLGGVDQQRLALAGASYSSLIASVMRASNIAVAGFSGVLAGQGGVLGQQVVNHLGQTTWNQQASPQLGQGRNEQYLFVWNLQAVPAYKPPGLEYWLWQYPRPGQQGQYFGFPRQQDQSPDMPPFTMFFKLGNSGKWIPVAILHAPSWQLGQPNGQGIAMALASFAQIPTFDLGNGAMLMGTFNVPAIDNVNAPGSNGANVFGGLAGAQGKYDQEMNNHRTALAGAPIVAIADEEAYAQTSDNFFLRRNSPQGGIGGSDPGILNVISASLGILDDQGNWQAARFRPALAYVEEVSAGRQNVAAGDDGSYDAFDDAFAAYRLYVSDHVPIVMTINY